MRQLFPPIIGLMAVALCAGLRPRTGTCDAQTFQWQTVTPDSQGMSSARLVELKDDPTKSRITIRHLGSHTSGIADAWVAAESAAGRDQADFSGWQGDFWRRRSRSQPPPGDAFTISRDVAPVLFPPGTDYHYSNPGIGMLTYAVTASIKGTRHTDIRTLLRDRVMGPIGVPDSQWSCGYGKTEVVDGLPLVASWGGGSFSPNATARVARLMLRQGNWQGRQLIRETAVRQTLSDAGTPENGGMGWWTNSNGDLGKVSRDAFSGQGAGHQVVFIVPRLNLIAVRNGSALCPFLDYRTALRQYLLDPLVNTIIDQPSLARTVTLPYPPSRVITGITWSPPETIVRRAKGSDNWPITWADDDNLYTAYGDGHGFAPHVPKKLSMGFVQVAGSPRDMTGANIRSPTGEDVGDGAQGKKASGMLMVDGVLYMWVRNAGNAQLAWSADHAKTWSWADWKFTSSMGCPTFLNFGRNYAGARDGFVYVYSHDSDSAYEPADQMVLARVDKGRLRDRGAYEFFKKLDNRGNPIWTADIRQRGPVFSFPGNCYRTGISYNAGLERYLWCQVLPHSTDSRGPRFQGGLGIYDAPEPWGPWTTVHFAHPWDVGPGETCSFPTKWMSADGTTVFLVFSGDDHFSVRKATLTCEAGQSRDGE